jgi:hypothetical protein
VVLERLAPDADRRGGDADLLEEAAAGAWGPYGLEISTAGRPLEGLRLVRVTDLAAYR